MCNRWEWSTGGTGMGIESERQCTPAVYCERFFFSLKPVPAAMQAPPHWRSGGWWKNWGGSAAALKSCKSTGRFIFFSANGWSAAVQFLIETDAVYFKFDKNKRDPEIVPCVQSTREQGFLFIIFPCERIQQSSFYWDTGCEFFFHAHIHFYFETVQFPSFRTDISWYSCDRWTFYFPERKCRFLLLGVFLQYQMQ